MNRSVIQRRTNTVFISYSFRGIYKLVPNFSIGCWPFFSSQYQIYYYIIYTILYYYNIVE